MDTKKEAVFLKILLAFWILTASAGLAHSLVAERGRRLSCMKNMAEGLLRISFYISQWQLPMEEIFRTMGKKRTGLLADFYCRMAEALQGCQVSDLGELWRERSGEYLEEYHLPEQAESLWSECFLDMAALPAEEERRLAMRAEQLKKISGEMEEKYRQERRPILVLGVCAGALFCLMMW